MLKNCRLYVIIDRDVLKTRDIVKAAEGALRGGADIIQLRDKSSCARSLVQYAKRIKALAKKYKRPFILNDRVDIARAVNADGVHLGQGDIPIEEARKILGKKIIGVSAHNLRQAKKAQRKGADYIGIGPIFKTPTKKQLRPIGPSILPGIRKQVDIPFFAIGGIALANIKEVKKRGADRIAVVSSAIKPVNVCRAVKQLKEAIEK